MFTSRKQLIKKSGKKGVDRFEYLQELVNEFHQSTSLGVLNKHFMLFHSFLCIFFTFNSSFFFFDYLESQEQVLANLANFSYDPLNYHYLRELKVIDIFISGLTSRNQFFNLYCIKGICNLSNDPLNQEIIVRSGGIDPIKQLIKSDKEDLCIAAITTLIFLENFSIGMLIYKVTKVRLNQRNIFL